MNVVGYVRVSTAGQANEDYSLTYQQEEIEAHCQQQRWSLLHVFTDEGISGAKVNEDALEKIAMLTQKYRESTGRSYEQ